MIKRKITAPNRKMGPLWCPVCLWSPLFDQAGGCVFWSLSESEMMWTQRVSIRQLLIGSMIDPMIDIPHWSTQFILQMIYPPPDLQHCECCVTDLNYWSSVPLTPIAHYSTVGPVCLSLNSAGGRSWWICNNSALTTRSGAGGASRGEGEIVDSNVWNCWGDTKIQT